MKKLDVTRSTSEQHLSEPLVTQMWLSFDPDRIGKNRKQTRLATHISVHQLLRNKTRDNATSPCHHPDNIDRIIRIIPSRYHNTNPDSVVNLIGLNDNLWIHFSLGGRKKSTLKEYPKKHRLLRVLCHGCSI